MNKYLNLILLSSVFFLLTAINTCGQSAGNVEKSVRTDTASVSFLFLGDIMHHQLQIDSHFDQATDSYDFSDEFQHLKPLFQKTDVVVGNLEVTFGGEPYAGYPRFSTPDVLAKNIKEAGIPYLVTANNHVFDTGINGFNNTLRTLDSVGIVRTGTFFDEKDKAKNHPMIIEKKGLRIALFNYAYGVNPGTEQKKGIVNFIDTALIVADLKSVSDTSFDAVIVFFHWGIEYQHTENTEQSVLAKLCFDNGADVVIGAHPHVIQPMAAYNYVTKTGESKNVFVAYSLGNYVSNYATRRYSDGGALAEFTLKKDESGKLHILKPGYRLVWVYRPIKKGKLRYYYVLPAAEYENDAKMSKDFKDQMMLFINDSRELLNKYNINVPEKMKLEE